MAGRDASGDYSDRKLSVRSFRARCAEAVADVLARRTPTGHMTWKQIARSCASSGASLYDSRVFRCLLEAGADSRSSEAPRSPGGHFPRRLSMAADQKLPPTTLDNAPTSRGINRLRYQKRIRKWPI